MADDLDINGLAKIVVQVRKRFVQDQLDAIKGIIENWNFNDMFKSIAALEMKFNYIRDLHSQINGCDALLSIYEQTHGKVEEPCHKE